MGLLPVESHSRFPGLACGATPWQNIMSPTTPSHTERRRAPGKTTLSAAFVYAYDFGDNWRHDIVVAGIGKLDKRLTYPLCIAGAGAGPPEDCGGVWGYRDLLAMLEKGRGEAYDDLLTWLGGDFDPDGFDRNTVNRRLRAPR